MKGALIFSAGLGFSFALREVYRIKWLRRKLPDKFFIYSQTASGILFTAFSIVAIGETLKGAEVQHKLVFMAAASSPEEAKSLMLVFVRETVMQLFFVVVEVVYIVFMLKRWGRHYAEVEREYHKAHASERKTMEDVKYQLETKIPFYASLCQNYVLSEVGFENKVFAMKMKVRRGETE
jgi:hypothetical protein